jgi:hypothetical protein|tara:strand:- start:2448 stop:2690 length:243 start_codon:yes stop_codon:yes gene_type:complete
MSKENKLTNEELKTLQDHISNMNEITLKIGNFEVQKSMIMIELDGLQKKLNEFKKELEEKYGTVSINIEDGTMKKEEEEK